MKVRLFIFADGNEVAAFEAKVVPRIGEEVWCRTSDYEGTIVVETIEHQFDRQTVEACANHDVCVYGREKRG